MQATNTEYVFRVQTPGQVPLGVTACHFSQYVGSQVPLSYHLCLEVDIHDTFWQWQKLEEERWWSFRGKEWKVSRHDSGADRSFSSNFQDSVKNMKKRKVLLQVICYQVYCTFLFIFLNIIKNDCILLQPESLKF